MTRAAAIGYTSALNTHCSKMAATAQDGRLTCSDRSSCSVQTCRWAAQVEGRPKQVSDAHVWPCPKYTPNPHADPLPHCQHKYAGWLHRVVRWEDNPAMIAPALEGRVRGPQDGEVPLEQVVLRGAARHTMTSTPGRPTLHQTRHQGPPTPTGRWRSGGGLPPAAAHCTAG